MSRVVERPPETAVRPDGLVAGGWWHATEEDGRIVCDLCPRECHLKPGDRGFCFVRQNVDGEMMLTTYGRSTGFCIDPIEKKPLNHFLPGTSVLSFGTAGCNLGCKFCQNWDISKSREVARLSELAGPEAIAAAAQHHGCHSVAYTYNDPVIWAEYAIDTARACRAVGIRNVAVTAGYISPAARAPFYEFMDAANVDLKAFTEDFYQKITYSHLQPVLETLEWLKRETDVWFEITNLIIPGHNDSLAEIGPMCDWILQHVGADVPVHFTAFHPDFRMRDIPRTPPETLIAAQAEARRRGLHYGYVGNVDDTANQSTYCPQCGGLLIERNWYALGQYHLRGNRCAHCDASIAGVFADRPGDWGRKRQPVQMSHFARPLPVVAPNPSETQATKHEESPMSTETDSTGASARLQAQRPKLTDEQSRMVHHAAGEIVKSAIAHRALSLPDPTLGGAADRTVMGAFVTLKREGKLRACCGSLGRPMPLGVALQQAAHRTATDDARLPTISPTELPCLDLDVSLLYGFEEVTATGADRVSAVEVGRHGLQVRRGNHAGLLLPNVAVEQGFSAEEFLRQVCRKAGLPTTAWQDDDTQLQTFETCAIDGDFDAGDAAAPVAPILTQEERQLLAQHTGANINSIARGAVPNYYIPGCSDGTVNGLALTLKPAGGEPVHFFRFSVRPGMPLQSTAFSLAEAAANALRSGQLRFPQGNVGVGITALHDPAMHGTVAEPDLRGFDPRQRALLVLESGKSACVFDPAKSPEQLLEQARELAHVFHPQTANLLSLACETTEPTVSIGNAPRATTGQDVRPPAVAGRFYPADAGELDKLIDECLGQPTGTRSAYPAVMVPHAGLAFSGRIAGQVFAQVEVPDTVIVIGPKHTRLGVEWAVAPHRTWSFPGGELKSDPSLAQAMVDAIPNLQLDSAAHQSEHGIEVELPFIARLNPNAKVVGIAIGAGDLAQCREFSSGLAQVLKEWPEKVLLVVSSDMNHYASDEENRRLDEIAMQSLETLDSENVYETVQKHSISMCGVLPAVMVMEAVKQLGGLHKAQRVAYATSAETSGDKSRVVGYCGMLFE